jgi:G6PDH family F420-dependent oxidoreductase
MLGMDVHDCGQASQDIYPKGDLAEGMVLTVEPDVDLINAWDAASDKRHARKIGQLPVCWGADRDACVARAHELFRWFGGGWKVNAELPGTAGFAGASQFVTHDDIGDAIPCGPDLEQVVKAVRQFEDAGFTDVALVQIGDESQRDFLAMAEKELLPALRT